MDKWLAIANDTLDDCAGIGDEPETRQKLIAITVSTKPVFPLNAYFLFIFLKTYLPLFLCKKSSVSQNKYEPFKFQQFLFPQNLSSRLPEGKQLLNIVQEAFTKATNQTPKDKQGALQANMQDLRKCWDKFTANVQNTMDLLKSAVARWEEYNEQISAFEKWLNDSERSLTEVPQTHGELSEMKTNLERYKQLADEITEHGAELKRLANDAVDLGNWSKTSNKIEDVNRLQARWDKINADCNDKIAAVSAEIIEYNAYYQQLQDAEKWLLQISFQLMAHNSLYITNRDQTLEQIAQHEVLLNEIQKYQTNIDDLKAKGHNQIERYESTSPHVRSTIETQLKNVQDSYDSLLNTAVQIRQRLQESLGKFEEYENILDSIAKNLEDYELAIGELETPATTLEMAQNQLKTGNQIHNKLHGEKQRLAIAVQACEAATASISRPSSPLEPNIPQIPEKELIIRAKLEDLIDQVNFLLPPTDFVRNLNFLSTSFSVLENITCIKIF